VATTPEGWKARAARVRRRGAHPGPWKIDVETKYIRVRGSGKFVSLTGYFTTQSGHVRMSYADLYERQPDGSVLLAVNDFGFREQAVG
jgi:hypothetical protein